MPSSMSARLSSNTSNQSLAILAAGLLVLAPAMILSQGPKTANKTQATTTKNSTTVTAGVPKEELEKEAHFKELLTEGVKLYREGKYQEAIPHFRSSAEFAEQLLDKARYRSLDDALSYLGQSNIMLKQYEDAEAVYSRRLKVEREYLQFDSAISGTLQVLGQLQAVQNHWDRAGEYYKQSASTLDESIEHFKHSESYDPQDIVANNDRAQKSQLLMYLAIAYFNQGKIQEAMATNEQAYSLGKEFHAQPALLSQIVQNSVAMLQNTPQGDQLSKWLKRESDLKEERH